MANGHVVGSEYLFLNGEAHDRASQAGLELAYRDFFDSPSVPHFLYEHVALAEEPLEAEEA